MFTQKCGRPDLFVTNQKTVAPVNMQTLAVV